MKKDEHIYIKVCLIIYSCVLFSVSILVPVFIPHISEEGKFGLYFLQDASFAWVSGIFVYFFGKVFIDFLKKKPSLSLNDEDK
jgi:hypothetical protein